MNIQVLFFASLREALGVEGLSLTLVDGTLAELHARLADQLGDATRVLLEDNVRMARNQVLQDADALSKLQLVDGDELAFLPPVTGG